jgi:hypothetical protein
MPVQPTHMALDGGGLEGELAEATLNVKQQVPQVRARAVEVRQRRLCFRWQRIDVGNDRKVGLDVALEALRDCWRRRRATMDELHRAAQARRMANVIRPYLEALV